jgi:hypothetical protein
LSGISLPNRAGGTVAALSCAVTLGLASPTLLAQESALGAEAAGQPWPWWTWAVLLFAICTAVGVVSVLAGAGGGVLFVPIVSGFFPFHLDYVRCAGILVALATALTASPRLMTSGLVKLRLAIPAGLVASAFSLLGVALGFALPVHALQTALGVVILGVAVVMVMAGRTEYPKVKAPDRWAQALGLSGSYYEHSTGHVVEWRVHRTPLGLACFAGVGLIAGLFGLGAGWANVPVLNLVMGLPLKAAVASSILLLSVTDSATAWAFINRGAVLPMLVAPSIAGIMLGSRLAVVLLPRVKPAVILRLVIVLLLLAGTRTLLKGLNVWG